MSRDIVYHTEFRELSLNQTTAVLLVDEAEFLSNALLSVTVCDYLSKLKHVYLPQEETTRCSVEHVRRPQVPPCTGTPRFDPVFIHTWGGRCGVG